jgi:hypothetical protein
MLQVQVENRPDPRGLILVQDQSPTMWVYVIPKHRRATRPFTLPARGGNLVPRPLGDDFPLELGEAQQNIQAEAAQGRPGIKLLGNSHEPDAVFVEDLHQPREIEQRPGEAVHLICHNGIDPTCLDIRQKHPEGWPLHVAAGEAAIVVAVRKRHPALIPLADDVRFAGLALGV